MYKYFPFRQRLKFPKHIPRPQNRLAESQALFEAERAIVRNYVGQATSAQLEYFVRSVDVALYFVGLRVNLWNLFDNFRVKDNSLGVNTVAYYFYSNNQPYLAIKTTLDVSVQQNEPKSSVQEQVEGHYFAELGTSRVSVNFKIGEYGQIHLRIRIDRMYYQGFEGGLKAEIGKVVAEFVGFLNQFAHKFAKSALDLEAAYVREDVRYTAKCYGQSDNPKQLSQLISKYIGKYEAAFVFDKLTQTYKSQLIEAVNFKLGVDQDALVWDISGGFSNYNDHLIQAITAIVPLADNKQIPLGQQHVGLSKLLQTTDPVLYEKNNIKHDNIYSRICQGNRQPIPVTDPGQYVTEYWNFTKKKAQLYKCNAQFPYLAFKTGHHKQDFCMPCCASVNPVSAGKGQLYKQCIATHVGRRQAQQSKYLLQNPGTYKLNRYTVTSPNLREVVQSPERDREALYVFCINELSDAPSTYSIAVSLLASAAHVLGDTYDAFVEKLEHAYKPYPNMQDFVMEVVGIKQQVDLVKYDIPRWKLSIQQYVLSYYNCSLVYVETDN